MIYQAVITVLGRWVYALASVIVASGVALVTLVWPNFSLLHYAWTNEAASWSYAWSVTGQLILGTHESMGYLAVSLVVVTALLLGVISVMAVYAWREKRTASSWRRISSSTSGGVLAAVLGIGCVACGPLLVGSLLALFGSAGLLLFLPLHGAELSFLAIGLLLYALYALARVITAPNTCAI